VDATRVEKPRYQRGHSRQNQRNPRGYGGQWGVSSESVATAEQWM
jgi:hypothetical protein